MATEEMMFDTNGGLLFSDIDQQLRALSENEPVSQGDDACICELRKLRTEIIGLVGKLI